MFFSLLECTSVFTQVQPDHVVVLMLENKPYEDIVGDTNAPFINQLLQDNHTALLTNSHGLTHPSQPNYLMLFSGDNQGVTTNNLPANLPFTTPNIGASVLQQGFTFKGYSQDLPSVGFTGESSGDYKRKHNPWVNWQGTGTNGIKPEFNVPFTYFPADFTELPTLSFVVPNQYYDMHNGTIKEGDQWIMDNLGNYIEWCKTHNSVFILTFDEDDGSSNNRILTFFVGKNIRGGSYDQRITHYNMLRTLEDLFSLDHSGKSKDSSAIADIWDEINVCPGQSFVLDAGAIGSQYQWQVDTGSGYAVISDNTILKGTVAQDLKVLSPPTSWYGYKFRCKVDGLAANPITLRFEAEWTGKIDHTWENPLNWACGLPDANTDVQIQNDRVEINSDQTIRSLRLKGSATCNVHAGKKLALLQ